MLQSTVQLGLDFLSPESLIEANRLADEIRGLPNDHEAKLQILEVRHGNPYLHNVLVCNACLAKPFNLKIFYILNKFLLMQVGKISLYAASWAIKEVQKLVLDPK